MQRTKNNDRVAVGFLDMFTKAFCIDMTEKNDLKFRCMECPFENHETKVCAVKLFKFKYCPDYPDFGSMSR